MRRLLPVLLLSAASAGGCAHSLHDVHVSDFTPGVDISAAKLVEARTEQPTVLGFVYDTHYVDVAREHLLDQCRNGRVEGITTQYSTDLGFFSWTNRLLMKGYCVEKDKAFGSAAESGPGLGEGRAFDKKPA